MRYCIRYAVKVLGKDGVSRYLDLLDEAGVETEPSPAPPIPLYRELTDSEEAAEAATWD